MIRALPLLLCVAACADVILRPLSALRTTEEGRELALRRACEAEAERAILRRDRGQEARLDRDLGHTDQTNVIPSFRQQSEAYGRQIRREELIEECLRANLPPRRGEERAVPSGKRQG